MRRGTIREAFGSVWGMALAAFLVFGAGPAGCGGDQEEDGDEEQTADTGASDDAGGQGDAGGSDTEPSSDGTSDGEGDGSGGEKFHPSCTRLASPGSNAEESTKNLERAFIMAEEGDVICMTAGTYEVKRQLDVTKSNIVVRGEGQSETVLDFSEQKEGANGILVQADENFGAVDFTIKNTASDALKTKRLDGVVMKNVTVTWDGEPKTENGAYGLYPVESKNVLIEGCKVSKASDAGVYLGQSENAIIRDNEAFKNVIGLEVENTYDTDVYNNETYGNTNGILVINLPGLEFQKTGARNRVFENEVRENNLGNFGKEGTAVSKMPAGSGILLVSANETEVYENTVTGNHSIGIGIGNYGVFASDIKDESYDPYPEGNWVHDNTLEGNGGEPQGDAELLRQGEPQGTVPQLLTMGTYDSSRDNSDGSLSNCADGNETPAGEAVEMAVIDLTSDCPDMPTGENATFCEVNQCTQPSLDEVSLPERVTTMLE